MYMSVKQAAEKWKISDRRVRVLCSEGKIPGVVREGRSWQIPENAKKPEDGRYRSVETLFEAVSYTHLDVYKRQPCFCSEFSSGVAQVKNSQLKAGFIVVYFLHSRCFAQNHICYRIIFFK